MNGVERQHLRLLRQELELLDGERGGVTQTGAEDSAEAQKG